MNSNLKSQQELKESFTQFRFEAQEEKVRNQFIKSFSNYFITIETMPIDCHYDIRATGLTGQVYIIELKERNYTVESLSACTWIEEIKINAFKEALEKEPQAVILYFNYMEDGYISFHIDSRFRANTSEILHTFPVQTKRTTINSSLSGGQTWVKNIASLSANPFYGDKVCSTTAFYHI